MPQEPDRRRFDSYSQAIEWLESENFRRSEKPDIHSSGDLYEEDLTGAEASVIRLPSGTTHIKLRGWL